MFGSSNARTIQTLLVAKDRASRKLDMVEEAGDQASESLSQTEQQLGSVTQAMAITGAGAAGLGAGIVGLTARFGRLDQKLATLQTTAGATPEQMERITEAAKEVSTTLPVGLGSSVEAAKQLSYAGLSASETMAALSETGRLAAASNLQAGQAAQTVARTLNAFQLEAEQTDAVVTSLAATFSSSATDISTLASGLSEVQAVANSAGLSVAETTGALGTLASNGVAGSRSGTALAATLRRITSGSGETQKALNQLNLSMEDFTNSSGDLRGITSIMTTLSERMEGVESQAERVRIANQLVGAEGVRALQPLIDNTDALSNRIRSNLRGEIQAAIGDLAKMSESELAASGEFLGMEDLSAQTTTAELIANLQRLEEQEETTAQITARLESGLGLTSDAAQLLARDITETDKSASELAETIGGVVTAEKLAEAQTRELSGQIQQLRSDLQVLGYEMFQGTKPAVSAAVSGMRSLTTPLAQNETAARALGAGLVGLTGVLGVATAGLAAHAAQLKIATLAQQGHASSTYAGTAALWAHSTATAAASKAHWLLTASSSALRTATLKKTASLWFSAKAQYASATAALSNATAMGVLTGAAGLATGAISALWTALGPIGAIVLLTSAAVAGLAGVMATDLWGAGDKAGAILGWFGDKAGVAYRASAQLLGILYELGRIGAVATGLALIAPFAALLKLPGFIRGLGPEIKQAAAQIPPMVLAGLSSMSFALYGIPIFGQLLMAKDALTAAGMWEHAGEQIPLMLAKGIARTAGVPTDKISSLTSDLGAFLPSSDAERGAFSNLSDSGGALVTTFTDGVESEQGQLTSTLGAMFQATPLGMAVGAASDAVGGGGQSPRGAPKYEVTVTNNIRLEGGAEGSTEESLERAAETGTSTALDDFFTSLSRET